MKTEIAKLTGVVALASAIAACSPTDSGVATTLSIQGTAPSSLTSLSVSKATTSIDISVVNTAGVESGVLTLTEARVGLKEIEFDLPEQEGDDDLDDDGIDDDGVEDSIEFEGPYVVDLITNTVTPSLGSITMDPGTYTEVELKLDKVENDTEDDDGTSAIAVDDPMYGYSIYLVGTYSENAGASNIPVRFAYDLDEEVRITADNAKGFVVGEGRNDVIIAFRLARWFNFSLGAPVDFSTATMNMSGEIVLDETADGNNSALRESIRDLIKDSADFGRDEDGSGKLESDEDDDDDLEDEEDD